MDIKIRDNGIKFKVRVSSILIVNNKLLVSKYGDDYALPGGYVELGETSFEAAKRESMEELGFEVKVDRLMGIFENFFTNIRKEKTHEIDFYYKVYPCNMDEVNIANYDRLEDDHGFEIHHYFEWIDINNLESYNLLPNEIINYIKNDEKKIFHEIIK